MENINVIVLDDFSKPTIVQFPSKRYPLIVIGRDQFGNMFSLLEEARDYFKDDNLNLIEVKNLIKEVQKLMYGYLIAYENTIKKTSPGLPKSDYIIHYPIESLEID
jgi:hypothetical protein